MERESYQVRQRWFCGTEYLWGGSAAIYIDSFGSFHVDQISNQSKPRLIRAQIWILPTLLSWKPKLYGGVKSRSQGWIEILFAIGCPNYDAAFALKALNLSKQHSKNSSGCLMHITPAKVMPMMVSEYWQRLCGFPQVLQRYDAQPKDEVTSGFTYKGI